MKTIQRRQTILEKKIFFAANLSASLKRHHTKRLFAGMSNSMTIPISATSDSRENLDRLLGELRPKLHRYCARMTGSVIDGEDVIQEAMLKALEAFPNAGPVANLEGWVFRIAHNAALDFLRRRVRRDALHSNEDAEMILDPVDTAADRQLAATSLRTFMRLAVPQRSSVILMDVLGYSLDEIATITDVSIPAVKSALHRGRGCLREFANEPEDVAQPSLSEPEHSLLAAYVDRFNARDFDAVRDMLAEEVRLELVGRSRLNGRREVSKYFYNYGLLQDWYFVSGSVEGHAAVIVRDPIDPSGKSIYFVLIEWKDGQVVKIRDFYHARYVMEGAELHLAGGRGTVVK